MQQLPATASPDAAVATPQQLAHFQAVGWAVVEGVFPTAQVQELAELSGELAAAQLDDALRKLMAAESLTEPQARELLGAAASGDEGALSKVQGLVGANPNASGRNKASPQAFDPDFSPADRSRLAPRKLENPYGLDERYRAIVHDRALHQLAWELLGGERPPKLWGSQLFMKPPEIGSTKPYHQDVRTPCRSNTRGEQQSACLLPD
jgi:hypothetical protein